jgi:hypothetical protein
MSEEQPQKKIVEHPQRDESTGFDYRTHIKDAGTGRLVRVQHYAKHMSGGEVLLERPPGSGNCFAENGQPVGRYEFKTEGKQQIIKKIADKHIDVKATPVNHIDELTERNEALERELAALRAEQDAQAKGQNQKQQQASVQK